jgi:hypothetical protein
MRNFDDRIEEIAKTVVIGKSMEEFHTSLHTGERQVEIESFKESMRIIGFTIVIAILLGIILRIILRG